LTLPKKQRVALELWLLGHSVAEIAATTGGKKDAVSWQLHTAKAKLKKVLH
jgi:DNA-directed RNA polymerase specialized sigma24 family protein